VGSPTRLDLVVGPNGAGKSTFVELTLAPLLPGNAFVNADEIAKQRWPDNPASGAGGRAGSAPRRRRRASCA
jgi:predicted ABC-type ATPase